MRPRLVVWGAGGHALVVADIIRLRGEYELAGFLDDVRTHTQEEFFGAPLLQGPDAMGILERAKVKHVIFGFGDGEARLRLAESVRARGIFIATAIHPRATLAPDVVVADGTVIAAGSVVNPGSTVGDNVNIAPCVSVDHQCVIEAGAHLSPGVHLGGNVRVGRATWVGIGAIVKDGVRIGAGSLVGAGALVLDNVPDGVVSYGRPARVIRHIASSAFREAMTSHLRDGAIEPMPCSPRPQP